ncbi:Membrane metallo-endopeptidase-like 1 [Merluccius polli]|uniref:Membrane metallo-endopeptidase-like 1 n=1 Tax=Merluccius polli TaxID=89951 RepID=A0AA47MTG9_MERPO|nr:Membrane metallo-endopeptidase-like 1 [Merluccius polli]
MVIGPGGKYCFCAPALNTSAHHTRGGLGTKFGPGNFVLETGLGGLAIVDGEGPPHGPLTASVAPVQLHRLHRRYLRHWSCRREVGKRFQIIGACVAIPDYIGKVLTGLDSYKVCWPVCPIKNTALRRMVVVYSSPYLEKMNEVLAKHSRSGKPRAQYRKVRLEEALQTDHNYIALYGNHSGEEGAVAPDCVRYVQSSMENAVGALSCERDLCRRKQNAWWVHAVSFEVSDLISKIQEAYVETLEELSWMDSPSKEKAREKVTTPPHTHTHTHCVDWPLWKYTY